MSKETMALLAQKTMRMVMKEDDKTIVSEGIVKSVDRKARTCDVERENHPDLLDVRLNAVIDAGDNVITVYPAVGSNVLCVIIHNDMADAYVLEATDIEEISGQIGNIKLKWTSAGIVFNDGQIGGLVKACELKTQLDKLTARVDGIINAINTGMPAAGASDGGAALQTSIKTALATITAKENFSSIENDKVKH